MGQPSADFNDDLLTSRYLETLAAAWHLSFEDDPITLESAAVAIRQVAMQRDKREAGYVNCKRGMPATVYLIPEVAAEVVGYARSHQRDEGLHVLVDVGAGTLDICAFILHQNNLDDCYELLTADVQDLGAMRLHQERLSFLRDHTDPNLLRKWIHHDPLTAIPDELTEYLPPHHHLLSTDEWRERLNRVDSDYTMKCRQQVWKTLLDLIRARDPNSPRWTSTLPVFLAGGASQMAIYQYHLTREISAYARKHYRFDIRTLQLSKPPQLEASEGLTDQNFHRLAVAWGLSYPETDIGDVTRPSEIPDIKASMNTSSYEGRFIEKDQV